MASRRAAHLRRARHRRGSTRQLARDLCLVVLCCISALLTAAPASAAAASAPAVTLLSQTPFVHGPGGTLVISLSRSGPLAHHDATVQLTLFSRLLTRDGLLAAIGSAGPTGELSTTVPIAARCLPGGPALRVAVDVAELGVLTAGPRECGARPPVLRVGCAADCDGVYPLRVTVRGGGGVQSLVTLVTFADDARSKLQVAWVLRIAGRDHGLLGSSGALGALAAHPRVPVSVDIQGVALAHGVTEPGGIASLAVLRAALSGTVHELLEEPYVPADLGALSASRLPSEVASQFGLTETELAAAHLPVAPNHSVTVLTGPATPTAFDAVASVRFPHELLVGGDLTTDPSATLSWGAPFQVAGTRVGATALAADTDLSAMSEQAATDPALGAAQFLGELAFLHFEEPNLPTPRVVTVLTNVTSTVPASFVSAALSGLAGNPVLTPITVSDAFSRVPVGANGLASSWSLALGPSQPLPSATSRAIRVLRRKVDALQDSFTGGASPVPAIDGALLAAERVEPSGARASQLGDVRSALAAQFAYFRIYAGPITLTATGLTTIPITVLSNAPYGISGVLELSSPRITFPRSRLPFAVATPVHSVRVPARALVNGDLPLTVRFVSLGGAVLITRAMITVRVTGFSVVGLALTIVAVGVLALWWVRTLRKKRAAH